MAHQNLAWPISILVYLHIACVCYWGNSSEHKEAKVNTLLLITGLTLPLKAEK